MRDKKSSRGWNISKPYTLDMCNMLVTKVKKMNDEKYEQYTFGEWIFNILAMIGAMSAFFAALIFSFLSN